MRSTFSFITAFLFVFIFTITPHLVRAEAVYNSDQEMEALDEMSVDKETEDIATDDIRAIAKEAKKEAILAEQERKAAEQKVVEAKETRKSVEKESTQEIAYQQSRKSKNDKLTKKFQSELKKIQADIDHLKKLSRLAKDDADKSYQKAKQVREKVLDHRRERAELKKSLIESASVNSAGPRSLASQKK